ncbi:dipeptide ABC transporter ATP-binding protein [Taylorella equigenitalis]|uniref:Glutathione import ATP-binding protein GsiA n=1 Tax=Taylorella equigenitalis 14/56 TaxID=1091497 RepID=I7IAU0_9BURK|nr:dipeptide ABC transporter ATP-binding protein [Taylorella equigenitalis]ASY30984.1 ABC transporter ATP-binding protein [Taylorella equigenitalis]ASY41262.1 ABC transporter ATP-binding protein [Taylorella equigenitalis]ASY42751.1 ABC transporter ATP-binding protein [Taylorella equigenitalis]KOS59584.1 glutathione ABC transporter ATP-binding protein [Taylorella equigenitalis]RBA26554.1 dipeptide ABC transporter ATP-binding protein [Taylorella equigenitalis]
MSINSQKSESAVLEVNNLSVDFVSSEHTVHAVKNLSFSISKGQTLAIVGESGSGKSVTSLSIMRLVENGGGIITSGQMLFTANKKPRVDLVKLSSRDLRKIRGADMAMIFQEPMTSLNPVFTVGEQIAESIRLHQGLSNSAAMAEALRMLDQVRIPEAKSVIKRYPHQLSGGMRQRVMIAMGLACKPSLLIADEPTTALDVTIQAQILQLIRELQKEMQMAVIFITHDMGVVAEVADRVLVMYKGEKVEENIATEIFNNPQHAYTKALLSAVPKLGSMSGKALPERFDLLVMDENQPTESNLNPEPLQPLYNKPPILEVKNLKTYFDIHSGFLGLNKKRVHAVEKVNFSLYEQETLAIVGESGCGKSTTGRSLLRLIQSQGGQILFKGQDVNSLSKNEMQKIRRDIQFIFQDPYASLDPRQTVGFSIMEPLLIHKVASGKQANERVQWLLEKVGLSGDMAQRYPHEFSGGQRQRICIARALALNPKIVIADESVSALDVSIQAQIVNLLMDLQQEFGISYLFISHDMAVVERISHRIAVMYLGQIVEIGSRQAIFENPQHPYTKKLIEAVPIADPERRHLDRKLLTGEIPSPIRKIGDEPIVEPLIQIAENHYVAKHSIGVYSPNSANPT